MIKNNEEIGMGFFVRWVLYTQLGYVLGFAVGFMLGHLLLGNVMVGMGIGFGVGYAQWLLLRHYVPNSSFWIVDNVAGISVALTLYTVVNTVSGYPFDLGVPHGAVGWAIALACAGGFAGVLQNRILSRTLAKSFVWVPASVVAWALSIAGLAIPPDMQNPMPLWLLFPRNLLLAPGAGGLILGLITGAVIFWILKHPDQSHDDTPSS